MRMPEALPGCPKVEGVITSICVGRREGGEQRHQKDFSLQVSLTDWGQLLESCTDSSSPSQLWLGWGKVLKSNRNAHHRCRLRYDSKLCFATPGLEILTHHFSRSVVSNSATSWIAAHKAPLSITNSRSLLKLMPSHPLLSPSPPAPNPSQHQGLFQWLNSSHQVAEVLEFQLQRQSFQWKPRADLL